MGQGREEKKGERITHHTRLRSFCCPASLPELLQEEELIKSPSLLMQ